MPPAIWYARPHEPHAREPSCSISEPAHAGHVHGASGNVPPLQVVERQFPGGDSAAERGDPAIDCEAEHERVTDVVLQTDPSVEKPPADEVAVDEVEERAYVEREPVPALLEPDDTLVVVAKEPRCHKTRAPPCAP